MNAIKCKPGLSLYKAKTADLKGLTEAKKTINDANITKSKIAPSDRESPV